MTKKENAGISPKIILMSILSGFIIYILITCVFTILIKYASLPSSAMKYLSKISLFAACIAACGIVKSYSRGEVFLNCLLSSVIILGLIILLGNIYKAYEFDAAGFIICLFISIISCYLVVIRKNKNSKLHKKRRR